jgi:hypothetical protein
MGRVYRVRHRGWDVDLAVKVPAGQGPGRRRRRGGLRARGGDLGHPRLHPHTVSCYYVRRVEGVPASLPST